MFTHSSIRACAAALVLWSFSAHAQLTPEPASTTLDTFAQAKRLLEAQQPSLQLQAAAVQRAEADVERAFSQLLPRLELTAGADYALVRRLAFTREVRFLDGDTFVPNATAALSITFSLSRLAFVGSAELQRDARKLGLAATRHQLIGGLATAMLGVLSAERIAARTSAGFAAAQERMRITQRLTEVGRATAIDGLRFSQDLSEAQSELVTAIEALSQARRALGQALGVPAAVSVSESFDAASLLTQAGSRCRAIASLDARPDRLAAARAVEGAAQAERAASYAYWPELRLSTLYSARLAPGLFEANLSGSRELVHDWGARASLVWTVYDGGQRASDVARAEADTLSQRAEQARLVVDSEQELRRARRLVSVTAANLDATKKSVDAAREIDRLSRKALELGTATTLEVVDAARRLRAVEITLALREVEELAARVRLGMTLAICE
jgi:outer membrane protein TolC